MFNFIHRLFNPHCPFCAEQDRLEREQRLEDEACPSCETLRTQLEASNYEKSLLIKALTEKPTEPATNREDIQPIKPRMIPWHVRRQMLEKDDRAKAASMKNAAKPDAPVKIETEAVANATIDNPVSVEDLEKELGVVNAAEN